MAIDQPNCLNSYLPRIHKQSGTHALIKSEKFMRNRDISSEKTDSIVQKTNSCANWIFMM